jgi:tRNA-dihydrouridine synthase A
MPGARQFRQILSVEACRHGSGPEVLFRALDAVQPAAIAAE